MKPALSIIFFTVSSGGGLGLLALIALADLVVPGSLPPDALWRGALLGVVLLAAGLASSVLHLANPANAWRSFSRFRTSWLSREAVFAIGLFPIAALYIVLLANGSAGVASLAAKLAYWYTIGRSAPTTMAHAIGVDQGVRGPGALSVAHARLLDVGHSHGTFLTDEFGFVLARRHATTLRAVALVL